MPGLANWVIEKPAEVLPIFDRVVTELTRAEFPTYLGENENVGGHEFNLIDPVISFIHVCACLLFNALM
jgi:hypothetical protein